MAQKTKVTFIYSSVAYDESSRHPTRHFGFSETWYSDSAPGSPGLAASITRFRSLRAALLNSGTSIIGHRISQVEPAGLVKLVRQISHGQSGEATDPVHNALFWMVRASGQRNRRQVMLRGVPDARIVSAGYEGSPAYNRALTNFWTEIAAAWRFKGLDLSKPEVEIRTVAPTEDGGIALVTTAAAHGLVVSNKAKILRVNCAGDRQRGTLGVVATVPSPTTFTVTNWRHGEGENGKVRLHDLSGLLTVEIDDDQMNRPLVVHRDTGRPFFLSRGRRPARRI